MWTAYAADLPSHLLRIRPVGCCGFVTPGNADPSGLHMRPAPWDVGSNRANTRQRSRATPRHTTIHLHDDTKPISSRSLRWYPDHVGAPAAAPGRCRAPRPPHDSAAVATGSRMRSVPTHLGHDRALGPRSTPPVAHRSCRRCSARTPTPGWPGRRCRPATTAARDRPDCWPADACRNRSSADRRRPGTVRAPGRVGAFTSEQMASHVGTSWIPNTIRSSAEVWTSCSRRPGLWWSRSLNGRPGLRARPTQISAKAAATRPD